MTNGHDELARRFEEHRARLGALAARMLGSRAEAEDAVQETWLRLSRSDVAGVENLAAWLTTVVSRVCLDLLRTRASRREEPFGPSGTPVPVRGDGPEEEALLIDSVGRALLVVLDTLGPAERVAFVLHDLFGVPFERIAPIVDRSQAATKKLASRARLRVRGTTDLPAGQLAGHRRVVEAFLAASRDGDLDALLAVLAPDVVRTADPAALPVGAATEARGARAVAEETLVLGRRAQRAAAALVDGAPGLVVAPEGRLRIALTFTVEDDRITGYDVVADPARLRRLRLAVLPD